MAPGDQRKGRAKQVRFWSMQRRSGSFRPNREVDEVRWVSIDEARDKLVKGQVPALDELKDSA